MEPAGWRCSSECCFCWRKGLIQRTLFPHGDHLSISVPHGDHLSVYFIPTWRSFICGFHSHMEIIYLCISFPHGDHLSVYFSVFHPPPPPPIICLCILVHFIPTQRSFVCVFHSHTEIIYLRICFHQAHHGGVYFFYSKTSIHSIVCTFHSLIHTSLYTIKLLKYNL